MSYGSPEFLVSCAAMILYDGGAEITADNLNTLVTKSGNSIEPYWAMLFASFLKNGKAEELILKGGIGAGGGGGGGAAAGDDGAAAGGDAAPAEKPKEEEVEEITGGTDMFGGGDDY